jgi:hypothetical protein
MESFVSEMFVKARSINERNTTFVAKTMQIQVIGTTPCNFKELGVSG